MSPPPECAVGSTEPMAATAWQPNSSSASRYILNSLPQGLMLRTLPSNILSTDLKILECVS